jgi:hypothetical protein
VRLPRPLPRPGRGPTTHSETRGADAGRVKTNEGTEPEKRVNAEATVATARPEFPQSGVDAPIGVTYTRGWGERREDGR